MKVEKQKTENMICEERLRAVLFIENVTEQGSNNHSQILESLLNGTLNQK